MLQLDKVVKHIVQKDTNDVLYIITFSLSGHFSLQNRVKSEIEVIFLSKFSSGRVFSQRHSFSLVYYIYLL